MKEKSGKVKTGKKNLEKKHFGAYLGS